MKSAISGKRAMDIQFLLPVIYEITNSLQKGLRDLTNIDISHKEISVTNRLFQIHDPKIDINHLTSILKILEPKLGEIYYDPLDSSSWIQKITQFSLSNDISRLKYNNIDSFKLRNSILKLLQNVLARGSSDSSYTFFENLLGNQMFEFFIGKSFQGESYNAPIVDQNLGIDETQLIKKIDEAMRLMFGYVGGIFLKQGLMTFKKENGDYGIVTMTHNYHDLHKFASNFNLRSQLRVTKESVGIDTYKYEDMFISFLISVLVTGYQERISTVDINGILNSDPYQLKTTVQNSPFLEGIFTDFDLSKPIDHRFIKNEFIDWFYSKYDTQKRQSEMFFEGRSIIRDKIINMLYDQISPYTINLEFFAEIDDMVLQAKTLLDSPLSYRQEIKLRTDQVAIKRDQIIRLLTNFYTNLLLNPQKTLTTSYHGDIIKYMKDLLNSPSIRQVQIGYSYMGTTNRHPFFDGFVLKFSLDYFSFNDLGKVLPTLAYTFTGTFTTDHDTRKSNLDLIRDLFDANTYFSRLKEDLANSYTLLSQYFKKYIDDTDVTHFTIQYFKELPFGFNSESILGHNKFKWTRTKFITEQMRDELYGTTQVFRIRDENGDIDNTELNRMISSLIYYVNHYDSNARVIEGSNVNDVEARCALAFNQNEFLESSYFIGTYSKRLNLKRMSQDALSLYYLNKPTGTQLSYSDFYAFQNSKVNKIPSFLLQEGNQDRMRALFEGLFRFIKSESNFKESLIQDLGYAS